MSSYRCYFLDAANHVAEDRFVECTTDDLAQARADALLADTAYPAMEVWDGGRFVCQVTRQGGRPPLHRRRQARPDRCAPNPKISRPTHETEEQS